MRQHGTRACYVFGTEPGSEPGRGCRCEPCREANRAYEDRRMRLRLYGRWQPWASDETYREVRQHLEALSRAGVGRRAIAEAAGVARNTVGGIRRGEMKRVRPDVAARLLAVTTSARLDHALIDAAETWRLLDELVAAGMAKRRIARCLGVGNAIQFRRTQVLQRNATAVRELHDGLWPIWPRLREVCSCYRAIQFERAREAERIASSRYRARREAVAS